jgi:hypothetical protein
MLKAFNQNEKKKKNFNLQVVFVVFMDEIRGNICWDSSINNLSFYFNFYLHLMIKEPKGIKYDVFMHTLM